jgi:hypothetical protein
MSKPVFVADNSIPGLGASDLARLSMTRTGGPLDRAAQLRRALRGTDTRLLRDLGIDRESC